MIETKQPGKPTYRRFIVEKIFAQSQSDPGERVYSLWKDKIVSRLDGEWDFMIDDYPSDFGRFHVRLLRKMGYAQIEIGLYRDGFYTKVSALTNETAEMQLFKHLFGNPNKNVVWTQETEKVPKIVNQLIKEIKNY